jgi:DNA-binding transcriptional MerR regulator/methylmalonyl-CoA mutase cobalamin-binding subunit
MTPRSPAKPQSHQHPMRVVTRRTGLSADLLRAWERRYEVVKPSRSESGRRLYSDADIERLGLLYRATLAGRGIGQIARLSTPELAALVRRDAEADRTGNGAQSPEPVATPGDHLAEFLRDCFRAIERLDTVALEASLRRAVVALPAAALLDGLVVPLLERVGTHWREGTLRPVHGHLASAVLRRVLDRVIETAASAAASPNLVVATPAGQVHEFGAMLAAATAAAEGWRVTYLGASLPAEDIAAAAEQTRARAVALSIVYPASDRAVGHELRRLGTLLPKDVTLVVGGAASTSYHAVLEEVRATPVDDLADFRSQLQVLRRGRPRDR